MQRSINMKTITTITLALTLLLIPLTPLHATDYILGKGDTLDVRIVNHTEFNTKQTIAPDGTVSLPILGRTPAADMTIDAFQTTVTTAYKKYFKSPQLVVLLTPRPIYIIQHDLNKDTWKVHEATSIEEAQALAGDIPTQNIQHGDVIKVDTGREPDFWEDNWYKVLTAIAVGVGILKAF